MTLIRSASLRALEEALLITSTCNICDNGEITKYVKLNTSLFSSYCACTISQDKYAYTPQRLYNTNVTVHGINRVS